jgi:hypothetical protein
VTNKATRGLSGGKAGIQGVAVRRLLTAPPAGPATSAPTLHQ